MLLFVFGGVFVFVFVFCYVEFSVVYCSVGGEYVMVKCVFGMLFGYLIFIMVLLVSVFIFVVFVSGVVLYLNNVFGMYFSN